jgi:hypothetical protein
MVIFLFGMLAGAVILCIAAIISVWVEGRQEAAAKKRSVLNGRIDGVHERIDGFDRRLRSMEGSVEILIKRADGALAYTNLVAEQAVAQHEAEYHQKGKKK